MAFVLPFKVPIVKKQDKGKRLLVINYDSIAYEYSVLPFKVPIVKKQDKG